MTGVSGCYSVLLKNQKAYNQDTTNVYNQATTTSPTPLRVRKGYRRDRPSPFFVQWGLGEGRKTEFFAKAKERDQRFYQLVKEIKSNSAERILTREEVNDWLAFKQATRGFGWVDVVAGWREHLARTGRKADCLLVADAVATYLRRANEALLRRELSPDTFRQKRRKLEAFAAAFGKRRLDQVSGGDIEAWISSFEWSSPATFNHYRKHVRSFYAAFAREVARNPADDVPSRDDGIDEVGVLTPADARQLFDWTLANRPEAVGRLALEAFAGLRFSSALRLEKKDINFAERGILLPRHKVKTKRRYYIDGLPDNLWAWLARTNDACWRMENSEWLHLKARLFKWAGVPHPHNCLRHSFCTYHVAAYKNPGRTATILCHRNQQQLWDHYYGRGTQSDGLAYFAILPPTEAGLVPFAPEASGMPQSRPLISSTA